MARLLLALALPVAVLGIYPDDHWKYSTKLTVGNFDGSIKNAVDADKTIFAPAWNNVVKTFENNKDVSFGDINLSEEPIRGEHNPGAGGWPTIKYFNKETGYAGKHYDKKTSKAMCDELGDEQTLETFVLEAGGTSLCSIAGYAGCSEKEKEFSEKFKLKSADEISAQAKRLQGMMSGKMKPDLAKWIKQRAAILKQLQREKAE